MKKRILSFLLALCMCLTLVPVTVLADDDVQQINDAAVQTITPGSDVSVQSVVDPDDAYYRTYEFYVDGKTIDTQIVKNGDTLYEPPVTAPAGKTFTGWEPKVTFGTVSDVNKTETIRVDAQFEDGYHVYFKAPDDRIIATKTGKTNDTITFEDVTFPVGSDEAITGWYTDESYADSTLVTSVTIGTSDITLYAKVEEGYWLTFESNGGSYVAPAFYANGTPAAAPDRPTKSGYTFDGWYTDKELTKAAGDFSAIKTSTTLYAKWAASKQTQYTVIHWLENADDDGYSYKESEVKTGTTGGTTRATAKRYTGFTAQTITQETIAGDGSTIVSVYYKRNVYSVKFFTNSGRFETPEEYTSLRITAKYGANISDKWPTYNGSNSWATSNGGSTYQANIDTMPLNGASFYGPKTGRGSETAYYYVEVLPGESGDLGPGNLNYKLHHSDTSPGRGYTVTKEDKYAITGFTYKDGTRNGHSYDDAKFYYTRNSYDIVFISGGKNVNTESVKYQASIADYANYKPDTAPTGMEDYVFGGWYTNEQCEGEAFVFAGKTMPANNITLYAKWVAPTYKVTVYDVNGETVLDTFTEVAKNSTISIDEMPAPTLAEGETFLGWVQEDGTPFSFSTKINRNYDLYAKVGNSSRYTVTYHSNTTPDTTVTDNEMIYAKDVLATVNDNTFTNGTKVFLSWNTAADGKGETYYPNGTVEITGDVTLYAQWGDKASTVSVTYHSNFAPDQTKTVNDIANNGQITVEDYSATGLPARDGYTFAGWKNNKGTSFSANAPARVNKDGSNDLYAQWTINQYNYTVKYYIDGTIDDNLTETHEADFGTVIKTYTNKCPDGYVLEKTENLPLTIGVNENANVINVFYKKNVFNLTIHYVYAEGGTAANDHTESVTFNGTYNVTSPTINGYTADKTVVSGTMPAENVEVTVTYTKRTDLSYTVHYYWNGTTTPVKESKTVTGQTFNASVTERPAAIEGYTAVSTADKTITIGVSDNVIIFYYYKNVELTANSKTETYDGTEKSVSGFTGAPEGADFSAITVGAKGTNVGTYDANFADDTEGTVDANKKYIVTKANNGQLKINPRKVTLTSEGGEKEYDGTPLTKPNVTVTGDGFVDGEVTNIKATGSVTYVSEGEVTNTITYTTGEKFNAGNYDISKSEGKLKITDRTAKYEITVKANSDEKTYDGQPLTVEGFETLTFTVNGQTYTVSGLTASKTGINVSDSGAVEVTGTAVVKDANDNDVTSQFNVTTVNGQLTINPRNVTLTSGDGKKEYDGTPLTKPDVTVGGDGFVPGEVTDIKATGSVTYVSEGEVTNTITYTTGEKFNAGNYDISKSEGKLKITDRAEKYEITVKANSGEKTYDGTALTVSGFKTLEFTVNGQKYTVSGLTASKTGTNVRDSGAVIVEGTAVVKDANDNDVTSQFKVKTEDGQLTIKPAEVTVTIKGNTDEVTYDGEEHSVKDFTSKITDKTGLYAVNDFALIEGVTAEAKGTNAGDYMMGLTAGSFANSNTNFEVTFVVEDGKLTIKPAEVTVTIKGHKDTKTYDGTEYTVTGYTVESISNNLYKEEYFALKTDAKAEAKGTDANTYMMGLTADSFANSNTNFEVTFVVEDGKLTIAKRDVTVTGESATKVYNGQTQEINGYTVDNLVKGHEMTGVTYSAKGKDPGKYNGSFNDDHKIVIKDADGTDVTANYNVKPVIGVLTITQPSHPTRPSTPTKDVTSVKTADGSQMTLWMSMMLASAAGIVFLGKKRKEEQ